MELSRDYAEGGAECRGPSIAFVPLRGTKDCAQDDSPVARELMSGCLLQTDPLPEAGLNVGPFEVARFWVAFASAPLNALLA